MEGLQMKRALAWGIGALALTGLAIPASAADLGARPITKAPPAPVPVVYNWTSCYLGVNGGGKWADFRQDAFVVTGINGFPFDTVVGNDNETGGVFGGQVGCQWQFGGGWVLGIEGDFDGTSLKRTFVAGPNAFNPFAPGDTIELKNDWQASVRGRLGYAWDRWMIYATGGVAFANLKATVGLVATPVNPAVFFSTDQTKTGWTVGGGFAYAITDNLDLGVEYRFSQFDFSNDLGSVTGIFPAGFTINPRLDTQEVTARLNWHFNFFGPPVAARY